MRVLVTGARSLLGAAVARRLASRGDEVTLFQRTPSGLGFPERLGSIDDPDAVATAAEGTDGIVHLAARVAATGSWSSFESANVAGTRFLLDGAVRAGTGRVVYVSSPSVAHTGSSLVGAPAGPADPDGVRGHYSRSKALAERIALSAATADLAVVAVRPHLVWGPGDAQLIGRVVDRARHGRLAIVGTGAALIDTTYVDNAADALVAALDRAPALSGRAFVVSNGQPRPVREILDRILEAAGLPPARRRVPTAAARVAGRVAESWWERRGIAEDPPMTEFLAEQLSTAHWFDQRDTRRSLGWEPAVALEEGFRRLAAWFASRTTAGSGRVTSPG